MSTEQQARWPSFGYEPVGAITTKLLARYLRTQRKNMLLFFQERGLYTLADRMKQIRNSRQGMLAKNSMFKAVLDDYSKLVTPMDSGTVPGAILQPTPVIAGETETTD